jgi:uncharacterized integral membrane protein
MSKARPAWFMGFKWVFTIPITLFTITFSVSNKHIIEVFLWPLPGLIELPVYILGLSILVTGFIFGYLVGWFRASFTNWRNKKRVF